MLNVAIDALSTRIGGGSVYLKNQVKALAKIAPNYQFNIFCVPQNRNDISVNAPNVEFIVINQASKSLFHRVFWQQFVFPGELRRQHTDLLYCPGNFCLLFSPCPQVLVLQNTNHFINLEYQPTLLLKSKRLLQRIGSVQSIKHAEFTVFISYDYLNNVKRYMSLDGISYKVIYSGVDEVFRACKTKNRLKIPSNYILAVSNFYRHKNYESLFRAFKLLCSQLSENFYLVVAGAFVDHVYYQQMQNLLVELSLLDHVILLGQVEQSDLPSLYANSRCYISTSILEAFPLTPFEAMTCGTPIVISQRTVFPEICEDAAIYFNPLNPNEIAEQILRVLCDPSLVQVLIQKGYKRVEEFSWERNARQLLDVFQQVVK